MYSNRRVNAAGDAVRRAFDTGTPPAAQDVAVVEWFRDRWSLAELGQLVRELEDHHAHPFLLSGQRVKRYDRIVEKLARRGGRFRLTTLGDIGGARCVVRTVSEVYSLTKLANQLFEVSAIRDYIEHPQDTGYRAIHLELRLAGRRTELQLRSELQHRWAATVEQLELRTGRGLKWGIGDERQLHRLRSIAAVYAEQEPS